MSDKLLSGIYLIGDELVAAVRREGHLGPWRNAAKIIGMDFEVYANHRLQGYFRCCYKKHWVRKVNRAKMCIDCVEIDSRLNYRKNTQRILSQNKLLRENKRSYSINVRCPACSRLETLYVYYERPYTKMRSENAVLNRFAREHARCFLVREESSDE